MTIKKLAFIGLASSLAFSSVVAEETTGSASTSTTSTEKALSNKVDGDIDEEITNARMRANSGSKSKFSGSISAYYDGGSVEEPLSATRPNLSGDPDVPTFSGGGGSTSLRYRINPNHSLTAGVGFQLIQPLQSSEDNELANDFTITNPSVGYSFIGKLGGFQTSTGVSLTLGTWEGWQNIDGRGTDIDSSIGVSQTFTKAFADTGFSAGLSFSVSRFNYSTDFEDNANNLSAGIFPFAEYQFNDTFVARTVFGYFNYRNKRRYDSTLKFTRAYEYQSVGIGIVASRDVWIYPNIQFIPDNLDVKNTNVGISASINMF